ncbi:hypothetical protein TARUN_6961 [Trichoderma arundinaceum]|uniref:Uncharacterized protein n=1 Tax=Trichoderma arundinaceum TaxID=490622 RepID=A0A395NHF5_TRIAR|nr:hypothetical protein TARUN_6961 [Trichoderma arundinaceum]
MVVAATGNWIGGARKTSTATMEEEKQGRGCDYESIWRSQCLSIKPDSWRGRGMGAAEGQNERAGARLATRRPGRVMGHPSGPSSRLLVFLAMPPPEWFLITHLRVRSYLSQLLLPFTPPPAPLALGRLQWTPLRITKQQRWGQKPSSPAPALGEKVLWISSWFGVAPPSLLAKAPTHGRQSPPPPANGLAGLAAICGQPDPAHESSGEAARHAPLSSAPSSCCQGAPPAPFRPGLLKQPSPQKAADTRIYRRCSEHSAADRGMGTFAGQSGGTDNHCSAPSGTYLLPSTCAILRHLSPNSIPPLRTAGKPSLFDAAPQT